MRYSSNNNNLQVNRDDLSKQGDLVDYSEGIVDQANQAIDDYLSSQNEDYQDYIDINFDFESLPVNNKQSDGVHGHIPTLIHQIAREEENTNSNYFLDATRDSENYREYWERKKREGTLDSVLSLSDWRSSHNDQSTAPSLSVANRELAEWNKPSTGDRLFFESVDESNYRIQKDDSLATKRTPPVADYSRDINDICIIDTISLTGELKADNKDIYRQTENVIIAMSGNSLDEIVGKNPYWGFTLSEYFENDLKLIFDKYEGEMRTHKPIELHLVGSKNGYLYTYNIIATIEGDNEIIGHVSAGGNKSKTGLDTYQFYLNARGCQYVWGLGLEKNLYDYAVANELRIKRGDIAIDDFEGRFDIPLINHMHTIGEFKIRQQPKITLIGDPNLDLVDPDGRTIYIGSRSSARYVRHYEKGKQLGDKKSPWVRHEVELKAKNLVIPLDIILCPSRYFAHNDGLKKILNTLTGSATEAFKLSPIKYTAKKVIALTVESMKEYMNVYYGKWLFAMRSIYASADEMLDDLEIKEVPKRLKGILPVTVQGVHCHVN